MARGREDWAWGRADALALEIGIVSQYLAKMVLAVFFKKQQGLLQTGHFTTNVCKKKQDWIHITVNIRIH